ncbi:hypothetical protein GCM10027610_025550 [Dactylosporangium cerinum]
MPAGGRGVKVLGRAEAGGHAVGVPVVDARQHMHVLGATGSGKSTQLCHMVLDDVRAGRGVVLIDPKGDLALDVLDRLPAKIADKVILIDPDQPDGATFNPSKVSTTTSSSTTSSRSSPRSSNGTGGHASTTSCGWRA